MPSLRSELTEYCGIVDLTFHADETHFAFAFSSIPTGICEHINNITNHAALHKNVGMNCSHHFRATVYSIITMNIKCYGYSKNDKKL